VFNLNLITLHYVLHSFHIVDGLGLSLLSYVTVVDEVLQSFPFILLLLFEKFLMFSVRSFKFVFPST
jgi:hypothetical protein